GQLPGVLACPVNARSPETGAPRHPASVHHRGVYASPTEHPEIDMHCLPRVHHRQPFENYLFCSCFCLSNRNIFECHSTHRLFQLSLKVGSGSLFLLPFPQAILLIVGRCAEYSGMKGAIFSWRLFEWHHLTDLKKRNEDNFHEYQNGHETVARYSWS